MKKVTTNITFGQILFILLTVFFASLMFFYLGAKFGPNVLNMGDRSPSIDDPILPNERLAKEIKQLLKTKKHEFVFHEVLQDQKSLTIPKSKDIDVKTVKTQDTKNEPKTVSKKDKVKKDSQTQKKQVTTPVVKKDDKTRFDNHVIIKKVDGMKVKMAEPKVINVSSTQQTKKPDLKPEPTEEVKPVYRLQLGSYSEKSKADRARKKWQKRGYPVVMIRTKISGKGYWYRLRLGKYASLTAAMNAQKRIMKKFRQSSRVVRSHK